MDALLRVDAKANLRAVSSDVVASLPNRGLSEASEELRSQLFTRASSDVAVDLAAEAAALKQAKG